MMAGADCLACSNRSRTRLAPTPTNISTKSEPEIEKNGTPASPATARASSVLPVPGGPKSSTPLGILAPMAWNCARVLEEVLDLPELLDRLVGAGDVGEGHLRLVLRLCRALALPKLMSRPPPCMFDHEVHEHADEQQDRQVLEQQRDPERLAVATVPG